MRSNLSVEIAELRKSFEHDQKLMDLSLRLK